MTKYYLCIGDSDPRQVTVEGPTPRKGAILSTDGGNGPAVEVIDVHYQYDRHTNETHIQFQTERAY